MIGLKKMNPEHTKEQAEAALAEKTREAHEKLSPKQKELLGKLKVIRDEMIEEGVPCFLVVDIEKNGFSWVLYNLYSKPFDDVFSPDAKRNMFDNLLNIIYGLTKMLNDFGFKFWVSHPARTPSIVASNLESPKQDNES